MTESIQCDSCHKKFRMPDGAAPGRKYRCPGCGSMMTVPHGNAVPAAPAPFPPPSYPAPPPYQPPAPSYPAAEDEAEVHAPAGAADLDPAFDADVWQSIRRGAGLHMVAHGLYLLALLLVLMVFMIVASVLESRSTSFGRSRSDGTTLEIMSLLLIFAFLGNWVLGVIAYSYWLAAPWRESARGQATALLALGALAILLLSRMVASSTSLASSSGPAEMGLSLLMFALIEGARLTMLASFVKTLAGILRKWSLRSNAGLLAVVTPCGLGGMTLLNFLIIKTAEPGQTMLMLLVCINIISLGVLVGWGLLNLMTLQKLARQKAGVHH